MFHNETNDKLLSLLYNELIKISIYETELGHSYPFILKGILLYDFVAATTLLKFK